MPPLRRMFLGFDDIWTTSQHSYIYIRHHARHISSSNPTQDGRTLWALHYAVEGISHGGASVSPNKSIDVTKLRRNHTNRDFSTIKSPEISVQGMRNESQVHTSGGQKG